MIWNDYEVEVLKKYRKGDLVRVEHHDLLEDLASRGFVHVGFVTNNGIAIETASLTPMGKRQLQREIRERNPIRQLFYAVFNLVFD